MIGKYFYYEHALGCVLIRKDVSDVELNLKKKCQKSTLFVMQRCGM
jgi:hypothetical protein